MTTAKQIAANSENALKSTGPKTDEGKAIVKQNAIRHGIYTKDVILDCGLVREDPEEFKLLLDSFMEDLQPVGTLETVLVEKITVSLWRLRRIYKAERGSIKVRLEELEEKYHYPARPETTYLDCDEPLDQEKTLEETQRIFRLLQLPSEELHQEREFLELLAEKYPGKTVKDLSQHQLKRLRAAFRREIMEQQEEFLRVTLYQQRAVHHQLALLVPDERMGKEEIRLERSVLRDLATLKQLQQTRGTA